MDSASLAPRTNRVTSPHRLAPALHVPEQPHGDAASSIAAPRRQASAPRLPPAHPGEPRAGRTSHRIHHHAPRRARHRPGPFRSISRHRAQVLERTARRATTRRARSPTTLGRFMNGERCTPTRDAWYRLASGSSSSGAVHRRRRRRGPATSAIAGHLVADAGPARAAGAQLTERVENIEASARYSRSPRLHALDRDRTALRKKMAFSAPRSTRRLRCAGSGHYALAVAISRSTTTPRHTRELMLPGTWSSANRERICPRSGLGHLYQQGWSRQNGSRTSSSAEVKKRLLRRSIAIPRATAQCDPRQASHSRPTSSSESPRRPALDALCRCACYLLHGHLKRHCRS